MLVRNLHLLHTFTDLFQFASYFDHGIRPIGLYWRCVFISFLLYEPSAEKAKER